MKKTTFKIMPIILAITVMFSAIWIPSKQVMAATSGITADGFKYTKYTIADDLVANDYVEITGYTVTPPAVIVIPSEIDGLPVTSIGVEAFFQCTSLTDVTIPSSVTTIGGRAFRECTNLTNVTISYGLTTIDYEAFNRCSKLTNVIIPDSVTNISWGAFWGCSNLTSITIPTSVTAIGNGAFGSSGLTSVTISANLTSVGILIFSNCYNLTNATISYGVTRIGDNLFTGCYNLNTVTIPASVTSIGNSTFSNCSSLTSIAIPNSVISIGNYTFSSCRSLTSIIIPNGVTRIGDYAFYRCINLTSITIPNSVTSIGNFAFSGCSILNINAGSAILKDYTDVGITGVTEANLNNANSAVIIAKEAKGSVLTKTEIQEAVTNGVAALEITKNDHTIIAELIKADGSEFTTSAAITFEWYRDDTIINGENNNIYQLSDEDKGASINVEVPQYGLISEYIDISGEAASIELTRNDDTLTAKLLNPNGSEFTTSAAVTFEWYRDDAIIDGENNNIYQLSDEDKGTSINVEVPQYGLVSEYIDIPNDPIDDVTTPAAVTVQIQGTETVGSNLTAEVLDENGNEFTTSAAVTYEWFRLSNEDSESGAPVGNNNTYTLVISDKDNYIKLVVYFDNEEIGTDTTGKIAAGSSSGSSHHHHHSQISNSDSTNPANTATDNLSESEARIVNNIGSLLGEGTTVGQGKKIVTLEGANVSVITITNNSKSVGFVISSETSNSIATIPIDGTVKAVYKYVPLLGKYIQVSDAVITENSIIMPVQANVTYLASSVILSSTDTVTQGWVQVDNKWYMVSATGDLLTGWINDGNGWTYLSPIDGVMQTGWVSHGNRWYYMKGNGYMATAWIETNGKWYYLYEDGSMAANTTINGYTIDSTGVWIS